MLAGPQTLCFLAWALFPIPPTEVRAVNLKLRREEIRERNLDEDSENTEFGFLEPAFSLILSKTRNLSKTRKLYPKLPCYRGDVGDAQVGSCS